MVPPNLSDLYGQCIRACGTHPACEEFFLLVRPVLTKIVTRVAWQYDSPAEVDDLLQEVNLKLISSGESILTALPQDQTAVLVYFSVLAANAARDIFRAHKASKRGAYATISIDTPSQGLLGKLGVEGTTDRELLLAQIEACLPDDRREQVVFRLYYRQGFTAREIACIPALGLNVKGVESMIFRITRQIRERLNPRSTIFVRREGTSRGISS